MPFGVNSAPAHFQFVMHQVLNKAEFPPKHSTFVDDVGTGGTTVDEAWENTLRAMIALARAGLPISIRKCKLMQQVIDYLGMVLAEKRYSLGKKSI